MNINMTNPEAFKVSLSMLLALLHTNKGKVLAKRITIKTEHLKHSRELSWLPEPVRENEKKKNEAKRKISRLK